MQKKYFVTGIDTEVGKTLVATILTEALQADYQKVVQAGLEERDINFVKKYLSNSKTVIHPECVCLKNPLSPHAAAEMEQLNITLSQLEVAATENHLIMEGAGGLMVPINYQETLLDWLKLQKDVEVIVVSKNYLGSINHSLMTLEILKQNHIPVKGIIFNGTITPASEKVIQEISKTEYLGRILPEEKITKEVILKYAEYFKKVL
ncbi:MAG: dethiobiotin synthase [Flavobacteriales bacterium]|jgi:dethiobiotin synthetase|nr:dethiobiotin synthase [Flavobacteriales bacterium]